MPSTATVNVRIADMEQFRQFLSALEPLIKEVESCVDEPLVMAPTSQDTLRARLDDFLAALDAIRAAGADCTCEDPRFGHVCDLHDAE